MGIKGDGTFILLVQVGAFFGLIFLDPPGRKLCGMLLYRIAKHPRRHTAKVFPQPFTRLLLPCRDVGQNAGVFIYGILANLS